MLGFAAKDMSSQRGKTFFVTGANTGIGFEVAKALAGEEARVLIGCRSQEKAEQAIERIIAQFPYANVKFVELNLSSLESIKSAAERVQQEERLDVLVNNAGIMVPPYELTEDGFESQFGVNHLGPFALTSLLLKKLQETPKSRIVNTSSLIHKIGKIHFNDINAEQKYIATERYAQSKLANLIFSYEMQRRLEAMGSETISVACHPGVADTELSRYLFSALRICMPLFSPLLNSAVGGARPTLLAAVGEDVEGGDYYGPNKRFEMVGNAVKVTSVGRSHDEKLATRLWDLSVEMTGIDPKI